MVSKRKTGFEMQQTRRMVLRMGAGGVLTVGLVACGGGGGGSESDDIDLRAAYDRIVAGMSEKDVIRAVGREPNGVDIRRYDWSDGNGQLLLVRFLSDDSGIVSSVDWNKLTVPTGSLNKRFD